LRFNQQKSQQIWKTVSQVPVGKVSSYGLIADLAGLPGRARMVGAVLRQAPAELQLPWHRIIKSNGQLAFKAGSESARRQKELLQQEGVVVLNNRVNMKRFAWQPGLAEMLEMDF
jgi:methylated-DNA-protein-cysteine methyltransferase related protein